jgi:hypothetical protein
MKKNLGNIDKGVRLSIAALIIMYNFTGVLTGQLAVGLLILSGVLLLTSLANFCPVYMLFGIKTDSNQTPRTEP